MSVIYNNKEDKQTGCQLIADASFKEDTPKPIKSFDQYRKNKGKQWKTKCQKKKGKAKEEEVTIAIGLLEWKEKRLKLARGKRIALRVSNNVPYTEILSKAVKKWKAYHSDLYIEAKSISLYLKVASKPSLYLERLNFSSFLGIKRKLERITNELCCISAHRWT